MPIVENFTLYIANFTYLAIFLIIAVSGFGIPFPEDIVLLISGYLASLEILDLWISIPVCFVSLVVADNIGFYLGRSGKQFVKRFRLTSKILGYKNLICRRRTIFLTRFLSGIRVFFPIAAGAGGMHWKHFFQADTAAVAILSVVLNLVGYYFGKYISQIIKAVMFYDKIFAGVVVALIIVVFVLYFLFRKKAKKKLGLDVK